jgi:hypothetical protein
MTTDQPSSPPPPGSEPSGEGNSPLNPGFPRAAAPQLTSAGMSEVERAAWAGDPAGTETAPPATPEPPAATPRRRWRLRRPTPPATPPPAETTTPAEGQTAPPAKDGARAPGTTAGENAAPPDKPSTTDPDAAKTDEDPQRMVRREALPTERPPGAPPDPWTAFARTGERPPGRVRRATRATGRGLIHEYALVILIALAGAVAMTWPTLRYPLHTIPGALGDPAREAWQIAWAGHILKTHPAQLWQANAYFPQRYSFAFGDSLLGYAPAGMLGDGPLAATLRYNLLFVLAHALLLIGTYALVRQLGAGRTGAGVAAAAVAFAPWQLAQSGHLSVVSAGGIPLALALLARGHGFSMRYGLRPDRRRAGWAVLGWLVAIWQLSLGFALGLPFAYVLGGVLLTMLIVVPIRRLGRRGEKALGRRGDKEPGRRGEKVLGWRLIVTDVLGALIFAGVGALIALPYFKPESTPAGAEIAFYSPPWRSLLIAPADSWIWGGAHAVPRRSLGWAPEMTLLPGFILYALALIGLFLSIWRWWQRLLLVLGLAAAAILTLGSTFVHGRWTYQPLFGHLPASFGVRVPGRLMLWVTLLLAVLAAGAVAEFVRRLEHMSAQRIPPWPGPWLRLATLVPLVLVVAEGVNTTAHPIVPDQPSALRTFTAPVVVLPSADEIDDVTMLWSTSKFQPLVNGGGEFGAARQAELRRTIISFPDQASVQYLRSIGVTTVILLRAEAQGTAWERAGDTPVDSLGIRREDVDETTVAFRLN